MCVLYGGIAIEVIGLCLHAVVAPGEEATNIGISGGLVVCSHLWAMAGGDMRPDDVPRPRGLGCKLDACMS